MRATGKPKTSIYFHIKDIPLSAERVQAARKISGDHIRQYALARKGKSNRTFNRFGAWTPPLVLLVAHFIFDGEINVRRGCFYNNRSIALIQRVEHLMEEVYAFPPARYVNRITGVHRISFFNVALGAYMFNKSRELLEQIAGMPETHKREFLRAFFDDEGCMTFTRKKRLIRGYQKDISILFLVQCLLSDLTIASTICMPNEISISGKDNLLRFQKEINFSKGVRINGNRSNSIWKESLEKRELLERAIKSFKN